MMTVFVTDAGVIVSINTDTVEQITFIPIHDEDGTAYTYTVKVGFKNGGFKEFITYRANVDDYTHTCLK